MEHLSGSCRVIAMDQRNAGESRGPISGNDGWHTYTADQLALMDHLGVGCFHVVGVHRRPVLHGPHPGGAGPGNVSGVVAADRSR